MLAKETSVRWFGLAASFGIPHLKSNFIIKRFNISVQSSTFLCLKKHVRVE